MTERLLMKTNVVYVDGSNWVTRVDGKDLVQATNNLILQALQSNPATTDLELKQQAIRELGLPGQFEWGRFIYQRLGALLKAGRIRKGRVAEGTQGTLTVTGK